jgi:hypothetical protein
VLFCHIISVCSPVVIKIFKLVHPHFCDPDGVVVDLLRSDLVGRPASEDVADPGAGRDLDSATAHPSLETKLKIFASPNFHTYAKK